MLKYKIKSLMNWEGGFFLKKIELVGYVNKGGRESLALDFFCEPSTAKYWDDFIKK